jgi:hypothetical protein
MIVSLPTAAALVWGPPEGASPSPQFFVSQVGEEPQGPRIGDEMQAGCTGLTGKMPERSQSAWLAVDMSLAGQGIAEGCFHSSTAGVVHGEAKVTPVSPTVLPTRGMERVWGWLALRALFCGPGVESLSVWTQRVPVPGEWHLTGVPCHRHIGPREGYEVEYNRGLQLGKEWTAKMQMTALRGSRGEGNVGV